jgi:hypothetical protein
MAKVGGTAAAGSPGSPVAAVTAASAEVTAAVMVAEFPGI